MLEEKLSQENLIKNFKNPPKEYTQLPFWFWNDALSDEKIIEQIHEFYERHVYGFVLHPRLGLLGNVVYLSDEYFHFVKVAVKEAEKLGMEVVLYDEAMYPSGSCHGQVVKSDPTLAAKGLILWTKEEKELNRELIIKELGEIENKFLVYAYSKGTIRGVHYGEDDGEKNAPKASDLLNEQAVEKFIQLTHEKYYDHLKNYFGQTIIGFFTDEPDILGRNHLKGMRPWYPEMKEILNSEGYTVKDLLLWFSGKENSSLKNMYENLVYEKMNKGYYEKLQTWCESHNIALMGHPGKSMDIGYEEKFTIPGQDMVWRWVDPNLGGISTFNSTAAKCSADSSRHQGKRKNSNEIFGCCGLPEAPWSLTLQEMQWYLNWLFVRGVNVIIPHAFFYSIREKRGDERPPDVGLNNLWWDDYGKFALYSNRLSYLLTDSVNQTDIAVLCEKAFLPFDEVKLFYENQIEFNYLLEKDIFTHGKFSVGKVDIFAQSYESIFYTKDTFPSEKLKALCDKYAIKLCLLEKGGLPSAKNNPKLQGNVKDIRFTKIKKNSEIFYLFFNEGTQKQEFIFPKVNLSQWDLFSGKIIPKNNNITLYPGQLQVFTEDCIKNKIQEFLEEVPFTLEIKSDVFNLTKLKNWAEISPFYSGKVDYTFTFTFKREVGNILIDFGNVRDILKVEGYEAIYALPYEESILVNDNKLHLKVSCINSITNEKDKFKAPGGILGPIKVFERKKINGTI